MVSHFFTGVLSRNSVDKELDRQQSDKSVSQINTYDEKDVIVQQPDESIVSPEIVSHM